MVHVFASKDPCGMGLQMEWGASLTTLVNFRILKHFLRMIFTVGSIRMLVTDTIRATMPQECWQIPLFKRFHSGYPEEVPNPCGKSINAYPIQSQKNVLIRLNFMEPQRILMIFV